MNWNIRSTVTAGCALLVVAGISWFGIYVWRSPHRTDLATYWAFVVAVLTLVGSIPLSLMARDRKVSDNAPRITEESLNKAADALAALVYDQWLRAATERKLLQPAPIAVPWRCSVFAVAGPIEAAVEARWFAPLPGLSAVGAREVQSGGTITELHTVYGGIGSGRLVIVGEPGAGKSAAATLLVLAALEHRRSAHESRRADVPVPILLGMHGWNPRVQSAEDWLGSRLQLEYKPLFPGKRGYALAVELIRRGRIAAVLDGLDEMPVDMRPDAMRELSEQATFRLVVLARTDEIRAAAPTGFLVGAAAIELQDIEATSTADYLEKVQLNPPPEGWRELVKRLRSEPHGAMARSLNTPLVVTLLRDTYRDRDEVRKFLDFCDSKGRRLSRRDVENHLLDRVVPVAYSGSQVPYSVPDARRALGQIACLMNGDGTRDLAWWLIPGWTPQSPLDTVALIVGLAGLSGVATMLALGGATVGFAVGAGMALTCALGAGRPQPPWTESVMSLTRWTIRVEKEGIVTSRTTYVDCPSSIRSRWRRLTASGRMGFGSGLIERSPEIFLARKWYQRAAALVHIAILGFAISFGIYTAMKSWGGVMVGLWPGMGLGISLGVMAGTVMGLWISVISALAKPRAATGNPLGPLAVWRWDRRRGWYVSTCVGIGVGFGLWAALALTGHFTDALRTGAEAGISLAVLGGLVYPLSPLTSMAFLQLHIRYGTPVRLLRFLEDARKREVLRAVGPVYQFRHARLQDRLAGELESPDSRK